MRVLHYNCSTPICQTMSRIFVENWQNHIVQHPSCWIDFNRCSSSFALLHLSMQDCSAYVIPLRVLSCKTCNYAGQSSAMHRWNILRLQKDRIRSYPILCRKHGPGTEHTVHHAALRRPHLARCPQNMVRTPTIRLRPGCGAFSFSSEVDRRISSFSKLRIAANQVMR